MRTFGIFGLLLVLALSSPAQEVTIRQLYQTLLAKSSEELSLKARVDEIDDKVNEVTVRALPESEVDAIYPLALQCVRSPKAQVREAGYGFLISVMLRIDSAKLSEPYVGELLKLSEEDKVNRPRILTILGGLIPKPPDKVIGYFAANLESSSGEDTQAFAVLLLDAAPADPSIVHRVLSLASARADDSLTMGVLRLLGLSKIQFPEAVDFISRNLNQENKYIREAAVDAASRLDKDSRAQLNGQLSRIASDPKEDKEVRNQAAQALKP